LALCGGIFAIEVHHVLSEENVVVALVTVKAERNGLHGIWRSTCGAFRMGKLQRSASFKEMSRLRTASGR